MYVLHDWIKSPSINKKLLNPTRDDSIGSRDITLLAQSHIEAHGGPFYDDGMLVIGKSLWLSLKSSYSAICKANKLYVDKLYFNNFASVNSLYTRESKKTKLSIQIDEKAKQWFTQAHFMVFLLHFSHQDFARFLPVK